MPVAPAKTTPKQAAFRIKMATGPSPPMADDWLVTIWYRGFDKKDNKKTIRVGEVRNDKPISISEEEAVKQALVSLRRYIISNRRAGWDELPKAYHVTAVPRHKVGIANTLGRFEGMLQRFRDI